APARYALYALSLHDALPICLRRSCGRFADQFGRHDARYEKLSTMIVEIHGGAFLVGSSHDSQAVRLMLDGLTFLHHLHNVLLDRSEEHTSELQSLRHLVCRL